MEKARQHTALAASAVAVSCLTATRACASDAVPIPVPSGQAVTWLDTVQGAPGPDGLTVRFRFVAPAIARDTGTVTPDQARDDMQALCDGYAVPRLPVTGPVPSQVIISLSDRPLPFGEPAPDATQFFEAYAIVDGVCEWQDY